MKALRPFASRGALALVVLHALLGTQPAAAQSKAPPDAALRERYFDAVQAINDGRAAEAVAQLDALTREIGKPTHRVQAALVRALAATNADARTLRELKVWNALVPADAATTAQLVSVVMPAQQRLAAIAAEKKRDAERVAEERRLVEEAEREKRDYVFESLGEDIARAMSESELFRPKRAIERSHWVMAEYPDDPRSAVLADTIPRLEERIAVLEEQERQQAIASAEEHAAHRMAMADERSSEASGEYLLGTVWLVLGLGTGSAAIAWLALEPIGTDTTEVVLPAVAFGGVGFYSLLAAFGEYSDASAHQEQADELRGSSSLRLQLGPTRGGAAASVSGAF
jgi:hypothetical protein